MNFCKQVRHCEGSVLISSAIAASILGIVVAGILSAISNEYFLNVRSQRWVQALHLAEAGTEIGFVEFNTYYMQSTGFQSARGWTSLGWGTYTKTVSNYTDNLNTVVGSIQVTVYGVGTLTPWILTVGTCATTPRGPMISRCVKVILAGSSMFPAAIVGKGVITLSGNAYIDSFNSTDLNKSTGGLYDPTERQANGNVASCATIVKSDVFSGSVTIYGTAATGPGGTVVMTGNSSIGPTFDSSLRATSVATGTAKGYIRNDFQVEIPDVTLPPSLSYPLTVPGGAIDNSTGTMTSGAWQVSQLSLSGQNTLTISGHVILYVTGEVKLSGQSSIIITPGSTLTVYAASSVSVTGGGVVNNSTQAIDNQWYGLPSSTSWTLSGGSAWIGTVYAPEADIKMTGNASASGAVVGDTVTYSGTAGFHYDESLATFGNGNYLVRSWQELKQDGNNWVIW